MTAPEAAELAPLCRWLAERTAGPLVERILLTGSRTWTRGRLLRMALELLPPTAQLVHGYARGADSLADQIWGGWLNRRVEQHPLPEGWYRVNRRAGLDRNQHMVSLGADLCLAFIRGGSGGATHCAESARAAGIPTFVFRQE